jgi:hypothetical protein
MNFRGLFATLVLLPVSALYSAYTSARNLIVFHLMKQSIQYFNDHFNLYPLWLSPMAIFDNDQHPGFVPPFRKKMAL